MCIVLSDVFDVTEKRQWKIMWFLCLNCRSSDLVYFSTFVFLPEENSGYWLQAVWFTTSRWCSVSAIGSFGYRTLGHWRTCLTCCKQKNVVASFRRHFCRAEPCHLVALQHRAAQQTQQVAVAITFGRHPHKPLDTGRWEVLRSPALRFHRMKAVPAV